MHRHSDNDTKALPDTHAERARLRVRQTHGHRPGQPRDQGAREHPHSRDVLVVVMEVMVVVVAAAVVVVLVLLLSLVVVVVVVVVLLLLLLR